MLPKPDGCLGCPLAGDMTGFVPDELVTDSRVFVLAQNPGRDEEADGVPMVGLSGREVNTVFLPLAGLERRRDVSIGNVLKCRLSADSGRKSNDLPVGDTLHRAVQHCTKQHLCIPDNVQLVVAHGDLAFRHTQGNIGALADWRGFIGPQTYQGRPVYVTLHTASLYRDPKMRTIARIDWLKLGRYLRGEWPRAVPSRLVLRSNTTDLRHMVRSARCAPVVALDTEYVRDKHLLTLIGLAWQQPDGTVTGCQLQWMGDPQVTSDVRTAFLQELHILVGTTPIVMHNAFADLLTLQELGIRVGEFRRIEDTMLMHSQLWSELPHTLEFVASTHGNYNKMKQLRDTDQLLYNWGDCIETLAIYDNLRKELERT